MTDFFDTPNDTPKKPAPKAPYSSFKKPYSDNSSFKKPYGDKGNFSGSKKAIREIIIREIYYPFFVFSIEPLPPAIVEKAKVVAALLEETKFTLRTDTVGELAKIFESVLTRKEDYLPWNDFNDKKSKFAFNTESSKILAKLYSPKFDEMKKAVQAFQARNARGILGQNVKSPIHLAIVWSADGAQHIKERTVKSSFIAHPLAIASALRIPIFNLERDDCIDRLNQFLAL